MFLTGSEIINQCECGNIHISPWNENHVNPNSYDVTLSKNLLVYDCDWLDAKQDNRTRKLEIDDRGLLLQPGILYLGSTVEYTRCGPFLPLLDGKSSIGRLGLILHHTAGIGDTGFEGHWTLEMTVVHPLRIYAGMRIGQLRFAEVKGQITPYHGKYQNQSEPTASRSWRDFN